VAKARRSPKAVLHGGFEILYLDKPAHGEEQYRAFIYDDDDERRDSHGEGSTPESALRRAFTFYAEHLPEQITPDAT
jgi:hypothetical protein